MGCYIQEQNGYEHLLTMFSPNCYSFALWGAHQQGQGFLIYFMITIKSLRWALYFPNLCLLLAKFLGPLVNIYVVSTVSGALNWPF